MGAAHGYSIQPLRGYDFFWAKLPWVISEHEIATLKGLPKAAAPVGIGIRVHEHESVAAEPIWQPFQVWDLVFVLTQTTGFAV